ncbi:hypothetical protein DSL72_002049 [Monilinia vaccinii-corymbosi]|uniref:Uncharacterized protein n=1 Tax=Monilinia vaccinii-corymbosi TaxID=61207 RepID=A0A8A3PBI4_9HELO|nr:hypothetical protein DSL72_002049 [Monilinia vaccinii-corymbosi]
MPNRSYPRHEDSDNKAALKAHAPTGKLEDVGSDSDLTIHADRGTISNFRLGALRLRDCELMLDHDTWIGYRRRRCGYCESVLAGTKNISELRAEGPCRGQ